MNRKTYRFCLIMLIAIAVASGVFYYRFIQKKMILPDEGTFVWRSMAESECI